MTKANETRNSREYQEQERPRWKTGWYILIVALAILAAIDVIMLGSIMESLKPKSSIYWGDNGPEVQGRRAYTTAMSKALGDQPVLNSLSDGSYGDERMFVGLRPSSDSGGKFQNFCVQGAEGQAFDVQVLIVNDNSGTTAENVRLALDLLPDKDGKMAVTARIVTDNASPTEYWSKVFIECDGDCQLGYVDGSAHLQNAKLGEAPLDAKALVTEGVLIGYEQLDGRLPGGSEYATYVTLRVQIVPKAD